MATFRCSLHVMVGFLSYVLFVVVVVYVSNVEHVNNHGSPTTITHAREYVTCDPIPTPIAV